MAAAGAMAVCAEDDDNRDGASLPRTPGGSERRYDAGNWSVLAAVHHAGVDRNRLRRLRAGPSESRTREPGATSPFARTYDCWTGVSPVCVRWGRRSQPRCQWTLRGYESARPCQARTHRYVDPLLQNRKTLQGHGRVDRDNLNSPVAPLDTRTMSHNVCGGFGCEKMNIHDIGDGRYGKQSFVPGHLLESRRAARGRSWKMKKHGTGSVAP
jgi:hypothetical protein